MNELIQTGWFPVLLLVGSNVFMTYAWYGHLKFKDKPLALVIMASWGIAFFEYCLMVPANRWGNVRYSATELKIIQEVITLTVFAFFAVFYLHEKSAGTISRRSVASSRRWRSRFCRRSNLRLRRSHLAIY